MTVPIEIDCVQGSPEWLNLHIGIPSAGHFDEIITSKGELSKTRVKLLNQLVGERLLGIKSESFCSYDMQRGIELEPQGRSIFEMEMELEVRQVGFVWRDERKDRGASPDGLIGEKDIFELKCPKMATHIGYLRDGSFPTEYHGQVQGNLYCAARDRVFFCSYYPGLPLFVVPVYRNEKYISALDTALNEFCQELNEVTAALMRIG